MSILLVLKNLNVRMYRMTRLHDLFDDTKYAYTRHLTWYSSIVLRHSASTVDYRAPLVDDGSMRDRGNNSDSNTTREQQHHRRIQQMSLTRGLLYAAALLCLCGFRGSVPGVGARGSSTSFRSHT